MNSFLNFWSSSKNGIFKWSQKLVSSSTHRQMLPPPHLDYFNLTLQWELFLQGQIRQLLKKLLYCIRPNHTGRQEDIFFYRIREIIFLRWHYHGKLSSMYHFDITFCMPLLSTSVNKWVFKDVHLKLSAYLNTFS